MNNEKASEHGLTHPMYCVKCRTMVMISSPKKILLKSSRMPYMVNVLIAPAQLTN